MKKVSRQKLALSAETIRSLTPANLGAVAGGAIVVLTTTSTSHSIYTNCSVPFTGSVGTSIAQGGGGGVD